MLKRYAKKLCFFPVLMYDLKYDESLNVIHYHEVVKIGRINKTISIEPSLYNDAVRKMRQLRIENFSKYVRYLLRTQADEVNLCRGIAREHLQLAAFHTELADNIEETKDSELVTHESIDTSKGQGTYDNSFQPKKHTNLS